MGYSHKKCEDEDDAARMSETILRELGYTELMRGSNVYDVRDELPIDTLQKIAVNAERIGRWARAELKEKQKIMGVKR